MGYRLQRLAPGGLVRLLLVRQLLRTVSKRFPVGLDGWQLCKRLSSVRMVCCADVEGQLVLVFDRRWNAEYAGERWGYVQLVASSVHPRRYLERLRIFEEPA